MYEAVFTSGSRSTAVRYSLETFRGVGFSPRVPGRREGRKKGGERKGLGRGRDKG